MAERPIFMFRSCGIKKNFLPLETPISWFVTANVPFHNDMKRLFCR